MAGKIVLVFALLAALLVSNCASSPESSAAVETKERNVLQQLLAKREKVRESARAERRAHLSEDEREIMTKQIMQAISEVMNSDCMSDRDYQGWVDFGRREAAE
ncbi:gastrin/cholecystokinin-like peptide [Cyprinodon tularosa]|uniref:gastrin/cholecystokinin-like peptide n=1 Tax=Cyprinodon tularosa TaxID=77115 RepID=UPI0018E1EF6D|nr:gastrin/cholecystokinin-like peptide [Cyprinodon tularosa]XP_038140654.1 gastrin/cholecystokinin-like peptide [Cyprinodon tularosa]XP_038140655.1 gastrin/cholecystokinin-like peptide [Cyprinodon tularosa]